MSKNRRQAFLLFFFFLFFSNIYNAQIHVSDGSFVFVHKDSKVSKELLDVADNLRTSDEVNKSIDSERSTLDHSEKKIKKKKTFSRNENNILKTRQAEAKDKSVDQQLSRPIKFKYDLENSYAFSISEPSKKQLTVPDHIGIWTIVPVAYILRTYGFCTSAKSTYHILNLQGSIEKNFVIRPPPVA